MESTAIIVEWHNPRLQQMRTSPNAAAADTETKEEKITYFQEASSRQGSPAKKNSCLHCQPLNEVWEGADPGSSLSSHSGTLHAPELPWVGPAFPPGAQSLLQAVT